MKRANISKEELFKFVEQLDNGGSDAKCEALRSLCPCRSRVYDQDVWSRIFRAAGSEDPEVRHQAEHAITTLKQRAVIDPDAQWLLEQAVARGEIDSMIYVSRRLEPILSGIKKRTGRTKIVPKELQGITRVLDDGTCEEKTRALTLLCPCRNRIYDREIWKRIFQLRSEGGEGVAHAAEHAIGTLRERAQHDPRSWKLLLDLGQDSEEPVDEGITSSISVWGPRNRPSRRKRMTRCKYGRQKAILSMQFFRE